MRLWSGCWGYLRHLLSRRWSLSMETEWISLNSSIIPRWTHLLCKESMRFNSVLDTDAYASIPYVSVDSTQTYRFWRTPISFPTSGLFVVFHWFDSALERRPEFSFDFSSGEEKFRECTFQLVIRDNHETVIKLIFAFQHIWKKNIYQNVQHNELFFKNGQAVDGSRPLSFYNCLEKKTFVLQKTVFLLENCSLFQNRKVYSTFLSQFIVLIQFSLFGEVINSRYRLFLFWSKFLIVIKQWTIFPFIPNLRVLCIFTDCLFEDF